MVTLLLHDDDELETCQLCGHEQGLLDELVQPETPVICQSTASVLNVDFFRESESLLRPTELEQRSWIKIEVARGRSTQECFGGLLEALGGTDALHSS